MFKKEKKVEGMLSVDENELSRRAIRRLIDDRYDDGDVMTNQRYKITAQEKHHLLKDKTSHKTRRHYTQQSESVADIFYIGIR